MSPLDALAPDQRAVVALVLQQGRSYEDIAAVLGIPVAAVRSRAHAGLAALAPDNGLPPEITAPLADYLLGQQSEADAAATRGLLTESAPARSWAAGVRRLLADAAPGELPAVPGDDAGAAAAGDEAEAAAAGDEPQGAVAGDEGHGPVAGDEGHGAVAGDEAQGAVADDEAQAPAAGDAGPDAAAGEEAASPPRSSRLGGALLIAGVLAVVALVVVFVVRGRGDERAEPAPAADTATSTPTPMPGAVQVTDQIDLRGVDGSGATGRMTVFLQDGRLLFQLQARNVPPSGRRTAYAVWFTGPGNRARRLGYTDPVGRDGALGIQGPSDTDLNAFPQLYATYAHVVVSRETRQAARRPRDPVLRGLLPRGRPGA